MAAYLSCSIRSSNCFHCDTPELFSTFAPKPCAFARDTSFDLKSVMNIRDDWSSPRITSLPVVTVIQKKLPADDEPSFYIPASENFSPFAPVHPVGLSTQVNWTVAEAIGAAPASIGSRSPFTATCRMNAAPRAIRRWESSPSAC